MCDYVEFHRSAHIYTSHIDYLLLQEEQEAKEPDNSSKGKQSATNKDKQKNPPTKRFTC